MARVGSSKQHHVIAIPAHAAAEVEQQAGDELQDRRDLIGDRLGGMEVAGIQAVELLPLGGVAEVKLVRADDVALAADAEEL